MEICRYRTMWVIAMFDLPVDTPTAIRQYSQFRKYLLNDGFSMIQFSVYVRHCASQENADIHMLRVQGVVPPDGEVRVFSLTDKQFEHMRIFRGKRRVPTEDPPPQLFLFT
jgi:CRISPR-associated protein Cas2